MAVSHGPKAIWGVGFWAQQPLLGVPLSPDPTKIFRGIWRSLPDQPPAPLIQQSTFPNFALLNQPKPPDTTHILRPIWRSLPDQPVQQLAPTWIQPPIRPTAVAPFSQDDWPNPQQPWRLDQTWTWQYNENLIGQDQLPAGEQVYALVPSQVTPEQIQLHSWTFNYNLNLIGRDRLPAGDQVTDLAPAQKPPEQVQLHSWQWSYNLNLRGKDQLPTGEQISDLPPRDPRELRAWQWTYNLNLIGQDRLPAGEQVSDRPILPIPPAITFIDLPKYNLIAKPFAQYDWPNPTQPYRLDQTYSFTYNKNLIGQDQLPTGEQTTDLPPRDFPRLFQTWIQNTNVALLTVVVKPFAQYDWPLTPAAQQPDRSIAASYNKNLIGQDQLPIRQQDWPNPIPPAAVKDWIQATNLALLTVVTKPFAQYDWPLTPAPVQPERSIAASYNKNLVGQDQLPFRQTDWPNPIAPAQVKDWIQSVNLALTTVVTRPFNQFDWPLTPAAPRLDQTFTASYNKNLIGKDQLPIGVEFTELPPRDPREVRSWTASFNLNLIGKDQLPFRQQDWPLTPAAQRAADLGTWIDRTKFLLAQLYKPFAQLDWPNPTPFARDPTLATFLGSYNLNLIGQDRLPNRQQDWPLSSAHALNQIPLQLMVAGKGFWLVPFAALPPGVQYTDRLVLPPGVPADFYTIARRPQIPQPTPPAVTAVFAKPFFAGPAYLTEIPGNPPS